MMPADLGVWFREHRAINQANADGRPKPGVSLTSVYLLPEVATIVVKEPVGKTQR